MQGTIVALTDTSITLDRVGFPQTEYALQPKVKVTRDGRPVELDDLLVGDFCEVSGKPAVELICRSKR
jgi:hypothetical protein